MCICMFRMRNTQMCFNYVHPRQHLFDRSNVKIKVSSGLDVPICMFWCFGLFTPACRFIRWNWMEAVLRNSFDVLHVCVKLYCAYSPEFGICVWMPMYTRWTVKQTWNHPCVKLRYFQGNCSVLTDLLNISNINWLHTYVNLYVDY